MNYKLFAKNTSWIIGGRLFSMMIGVVITALTARYLGASNFGLLAYASSIVAMFTAISTLGLRDTLVNELKDEPNKYDEILGTSILMRFMASIACMLLIYIVVILLEPDSKLLIILVSFYSSALIFKSINLIDLWYLSNLNSKIVIILNFIVYISVSVYRVVILYFEMGIEWFAFTMLLEVILSSALLLYHFSYRLNFRLKFNRRLIIPMLSRSKPYIYSGIMIALYTQIDRVMIGKMLDSSSVGFYSAGVAICSLWTFVLFAIIESSRPVIIDSRNISLKLYELNIKRLYALVIWLSIFAAIFISFFSEFIILILYGQSFLPATNTLMILTWCTIFSFLGVAKSIWLISEGKQRYEKWFTFIGLVFNLILNYFLIPVLGIEGAAISTLVTQFLTNFLVPLIIKDTRKTSLFMIDALLLRNVISRKECDRLFLFFTNYLK